MSEDERGIEGIDLTWAVAGPRNGQCLPRTSVFSTLKMGNAQIWPHSPFRPQGVASLENMSGSGRKKKKKKRREENAS